MALPAPKKLSKKVVKQKKVRIFVTSKRFLLADGQLGLIGNPV